MLLYNSQLQAFAFYEGLLRVAGASTDRECDSRAKVFLTGCVGGSVILQG